MFVCRAPLNLAGETTRFAPDRLDGLKLAVLPHDRRHDGFACYAGRAPVLWGRSMHEEMSLDETHAERPAERGGEHAFVRFRRTDITAPVKTPAETPVKTPEEATGKVEPAPEDADGLGDADAIQPAASVDGPELERHASEASDAASDAPADEEADEVLAPSADLDMSGEDGDGHDTIEAALRTPDAEPEALDPLDSDDDSFEAKLARVLREAEAIAEAAPRPRHFVGPYEALLAQSEERECVEESLPEGFLDQLGAVLASIGESTNELDEPVSEHAGDEHAPDNEHVDCEAGPEAPDDARDEPGESEPPTPEEPSESAEGGAEASQREPWQEAMREARACSGMSRSLALGRAAAMATLSASDAFAELLSVASALTDEASDATADLIEAFLAWANAIEDEPDADEINAWRRRLDANATEGDEEPPQDPFGLDEIAPEDEIDGACDDGLLVEPDIEPAITAPEDSASDEASAEEPDASPTATPIDDAAEIEAEFGEPPVIEASRAQATGEPLGGDGSIRVDRATFEKLADAARGLVLNKNQVQRLAASDTSDREALRAAGLEYDRLLSNLHDAIDGARSEPASSIIEPHRKPLEDIARARGGAIALHVTGGHVLIDAFMLRQIAEPIEELMKYCAARGVEAPEAREAAGKPSHATIRVEVERRGTHIAMTVADDGRGEREADEAADLEGVEARLGRAGGFFSDRSVRGEGSRFEVLLPVPSPVVDAIRMAIGEGRYAVPVSKVCAIVRLAEHTRATIRGRPTLRVRDEVLPLIDLHGAFGMRGTSEDQDAVIIEAAGIRAAFIVDEILGHEEIVLDEMGLGGHERGPFIGATVEGDESIGLVIDADRVVASVA